MKKTCFLFLNLLCIFSSLSASEMYIARSYVIDHLNWCIQDFVNELPILDKNDQDSTYYQGRIDAYQDIIEFLEYDEELED